MTTILLICYLPWGWVVISPYCPVFSSTSWAWEQLSLPSPQISKFLDSLSSFSFLLASASSFLNLLSTIYSNQIIVRFCFSASVPGPTNFWGKLFAFKVTVSNTFTKCVATICYGSWSFQLLISCFAIQQLGQCHLFCSFVTPAPSLEVLISASEGISSLCYENKISMP